jgi:hypothetical protein
MCVWMCVYVCVYVYKYVYMYVCMYASNVRMYVYICLIMFDLNSSHSLCCPTVRSTSQTTLHWTFYTNCPADHWSYVTRRQTDRLYISMRKLQYRQPRRHNRLCLSVWVQVTFTYGCDPPSQLRFVLRIISAPTGNSLLTLEVKTAVCHSSLTVSQSTARCKEQNNNVTSNISLGSFSFQTIWQAVVIARYTDRALTAQQNAVCVYVRHN